MRINLANPMLLHLISNKDYLVFRDKDGNVLAAGRVDIIKNIEADIVVGGETIKFSDVFAVST